MVERVSIELVSGHLGLRGAVFRYDVLRRLRKGCDGRDTSFLAFGFAEDWLRIVVDGSSDDVREVVRGLKVGTVRAAARWGLALTSGHHRREACDSLEDAIRWAHEAPAPELGPLSTVWSSHRDLLGFRRAGFFDASVPLARVDPVPIHRALGGTLGRLEEPPPREPPLGATMVRVLRAAAAVVGVVPSDRRCFRAFVHAGRWCGFGTQAMAHALSLTDRRVRQLAAEPEPDVDLVRRTLVDPVLSRIP